MDNMVSLAFVVGAVLLRSEERRIVLERFWASDPQLIFDCVVTSSIGSFNGVKRSINLSSRSELGEANESACLL